MLYNGYFGCVQHLSLIVYLLIIYLIPFIFWCETVNVLRIKVEFLFDGLEIIAAENLGRTQSVGC